MRINLDDCDVPVPLAEDLWPNITSLPQTILDTYLPSDWNALGELYERQCKQDQLLARLLRSHYQRNRIGLAIDEIELHEQEIHQCRDGIANHADHVDIAVRSYSHYVQMCHE